MICHSCKTQCGKFGKDRRGHQAFRCRQCERTFTEPHNGHMAGMYVPIEKAASIIQTLVEGISIRRVERITGVDRDTIVRLLLIAGEHCEDFLERRLERVPLSDIQCDEIWGYVGCKEKRNVDAAEDRGDTYCFVALERNTKLVIAWHLGKRTARDTLAFTDKIDEATAGRFQITTDGFKAYVDAVHYSLGTREDFAQLVKVYAAPWHGEQRYSPAEVADAVPVPRWGRPEPQNICTSHVKRQNLTMRMHIPRLTRLTNAFSKKWESLKAAVAVHFAHYNFCRRHQTIRVTPAMEAGLTDNVWGIAELLEATQI